MAGRLLAGAIGAAAGAVGATVLLTALSVFAPAQPPAAIAPVTAPVPPPDEDERAAVLLARNALLALNQANLANNYEVLRGLAAPSFREKNTPVRLGEAFKSFRDAGTDFAPIAVIEPVFDAAVAAGADGRLVMTGYFDSPPMRLRFQLAFELVDQLWLLSDLAVELKDVSAPPGAPAAPSPAEPAAPPPTP